jgi:chromosome segregation ATPase
MEMMRVQLLDLLERERFEHRQQADRYEDRISELELQVKEYEEKMGKLRRSLSETQEARPAAGTPERS